MKTDARLFAPFPIEMDEHPKIFPLSDAAFRAVFEATFYSRRMLSDGFLDERVVLKRWGREVADELSSNDPLRPSWVRVEGGWQIHDFDKHHPLRADIEAKRAAVSTRRKLAGSKGLANRWQTDGKSVANDSSETETDAETTKELVQDKPAHDITNDFNEWWQTYPRKQGKADALKAYKVIRKKVAADVLVKGAQTYSLLNAGEDKAFLKLPAGWLRGQRWEDEPLAAATPTRSGTTQPATCPHDYPPADCPYCDGRDF